MNGKNALEKHILLYIPWAIALLFSSIPVLSYLVAWLGSFFIFFVSLTGKIKPLPTDRTKAEQLMRPIFIIQLIFAGYMCCTSIFYFLSILGYEYFEKTNSILAIDPEKIDLTAQCQRYYCLGHAAFVSGMLIFMKYPVEKKYHFESEKLANLLLITALTTFPISLIFLHLPGLAQFYFQLSSLSFISGTLALAFALPQQKLFNTLLCAALYLFNFYQALTSGFKEPIIISVLVLGVFLYPNYKKIVTVVFVPVLLLLFVVLPSYVSSFRQSVWSGDESTDNATQIAVDAALNKDTRDDTNWGFLVYRLSEIEMFTWYVRSTPNYVDFYGTLLLKQSAIAIIPRVLWPSKPITEDLVMQRVYDAGIVNKNSSVSAKPQFIVDAYLSYGTLGIFIYLFAYGAAAQLIALKAEKLFGGYVLGTALIFSGLFQIFWRGLSFEFIINTVFLELHQHARDFQDYACKGDLKKDLKILQICAAYKPAFIYGGPTMSVAKLSEELVKAGVAVNAFATTANGKTELPVTPGEKINVDGVEVIYFKRQTKDHSHFSPALLKRLWRDAKEYDLIHIHAWWNLVSVFSAMIGLIKKTPVVLSPRGTLSPYSFNNKNIGVKWLIHNLLGKHLLKRLHFHVTSTREGTASTALIKPKSITAIPNFVNIPRDPSGQQREKSGIFRLLFFSRIEEKKGLEILLDALPQLTLTYHLTVAGDGERTYVKKLKTIVKNNGADKYIEWVGFRGAEKFSLLGRHDLLILPSYDENFGNVVIESLSEGTAVLLSPFVGLTDYVKQNNFGWECDLNAVSISGMIDYIYRKQVELELIRQQAPAIIRKDFDEQNLVKQYTEMYKTIING